jgi:hypothetical protein
MCCNTPKQFTAPYGVFRIIHDGKFIAARPISATRFVNIMRREAGQIGAGNGASRSA